MNTMIFRRAFMTHLPLAKPSSQPLSSPRKRSYPSTMPFIETPLHVHRHRAIVVDHPVRTRVGGVDIG